MPVYRFPRLFSFALTAAVTLRRGGPLELVLTWGALRVRPLSPAAQAILPSIELRHAFPPQQTSK